MKMLIDTNIFLEVILEQEKAEEVRRLLSKTEEHDFFLSECALGGRPIMKREDIISFIAANKAKFEQEFGLKRIGLFGSYARGEVRGESDIDIVVEIEKPDLFYLIGIKQAIEEALGNRVDIVRLRDTMNQALRSRIERDVIYV